MATRSKLTRRKAKSSPSTSAVSAPAGAPIPAADVSTALPVQELIDQLFEIGCRVAVYAHAAEELNNVNAPHAEMEAAGALPVALGEIHRNLLEIVNRLQDLEREAQP
jgi:hypothetical protein